MQTIKWDVKTRMVANGTSKNSWGEPWIVIGAFPFQFLIRILSGSGQEASCFVIVMSVATLLCWLCNVLSRSYLVTWLVCNWVEKIFLAHLKKKKKNNVPLIPIEHVFITILKYKKYTSSNKKCVTKLSLGVPGKKRQVTPFSKKKKKPGIKRKSRGWKQSKGWI